MKKEANVGVPGDRERMAVDCGRAYNFDDQPKQAVDHQAPAITSPNFPQEPFAVQQKQQKARITQLDEGYRRLRHGLVQNFLTRTKSRPAAPSQAPADPSSPFRSPAFSKDPRSIPTSISSATDWPTNPQLLSSVSSSRRRHHGRRACDGDDHSGSCRRSCLSEFSSKYQLARASWQVPRGVDVNRACEYADRSYAVRAEQHRRRLEALQRQLRTHKADGKAQWKKEYA